MNFQEALKVCSNVLAQRTPSKSIAYTLFASNDATKYEHRMSGYTIKQLITEFRALGKSYRYAVITKSNDVNKVLRYHDSLKSKKFFSMTRTGGKRKK